MRAAPVVVLAVATLSACATPGETGGPSEAAAPPPPRACAACGRPLGTDASASLEALLASPSIRRASVEGKYRGLLRILAVPGDLDRYGEFRDWGRWEGTSYGGFEDLPPAYWVYLHPDWYLWAAAREDPWPASAYPR